MSADVVFRSGQHGEPESRVETAQCMVRKTIQLQRKLQAKEDKTGRMKLVS